MSAAEKHALGAIEVDQLAVLRHEHVELRLRLLLLRLMHLVEEAGENGARDAPRSDVTHLLLRILLHTYDRALLQLQSVLEAASQQLQRPACDAHGERALHGDMRLEDAPPPAVDGERRVGELRSPQASKPASKSQSLE